MKAKYRDLFGNIKEEKVETEKQIICALENPECVEVCDKNYSLRKNGELYELESVVLPDNRSLIVKTFNSLVRRVQIEDIGFYIVGVSEMNRNLFTTFRDFIRCAKIYINDYGVVYINAGDIASIYYDKEHKSRTVVTNVNTKLISELIKEIEGQ